MSIEAKNVSSEKVPFKNTPAFWIWIGLLVFSFIEVILIFLLEPLLRINFPPLNPDTGPADYYWTFLRRHTLRFHGFWGTGSDGLPLYKFHNRGRPNKFIGMNYDQMFGNRMTILRCDYRLEIKKNLFVKAMGNIAFDYEYKSHADAYKADNLHGFGIGILFHTPFGNAEAMVSLGDETFTGERKWQNLGYIQIGTKF